MPNRRQLCVVGSGLLGTSVAWAATRAGWTVCVTDRRRDHAQAAADLGAAASVATDPRAAASHADGIVLAVPVSAAASVLDVLGSVVPTSAWVTDVLGTKVSVGRHAAAVGLADRFTGAHPMAGSEDSGPRAATPDLLHEARCFIVPGDADPRPVEAFWQELGCRTVRIDAATHDRLLASSSHLPQVVASALAAGLADDVWPAGGRGLRDMTRLAGSDPDVWAGLLVDNAAHVSPAVRRLTAMLADVADALDAGDADELRALIAAGRSRRDRHRPPPDAAG